jgi:hypothetical protein
MNNWGEIKKLAIVEADDFQDKYDRSGLEMLFYWKAKYPKFKITLFTIPNKFSQGMFNLIAPHNDWIELAWHGWDHDSNYECWEWDYEKTLALGSRLQEKSARTEEYMMWYQKIFKAPGWMITGNEAGDGSGYPLQPHNKLASDNQGVYKALRDMNFIVFDRHYNKQFRPEGLQCVCVDCNPDIIHMHTWDMPTGDLAGKNGFRQVEELHGVPWNENTEFKFVSEAWEEKLFQSCKK